MNERVRSLVFSTVPLEDTHSLWIDTSTNGYWIIKCFINGVWTPIGIPLLSTGADNEFLKFTATGVEGRTYAEVLSDIGALAALTFGIANTNKVQINAADVTDNDYAKFTATGLEGRSYSEVLSDIGAHASGGSLSTAFLASLIGANSLYLKTTGFNAGTFVANGATPVVVADTALAITDTILISLNTIGGTVGAVPAVTAMTASTSFAVTATAGDTSTYNYIIIQKGA